MATSTSQRPQLIGPRKQDEESKMKIPVTIEFAAPALEPPVFICSNLTEPQWDIVEMDCFSNDNGDVFFSKCFRAEEGEYQYKFRLGLGDWWVIDETKPTVADDSGNRNNVVYVTQAQTKGTAASILDSISDAAKMSSILAGSPKDDDHPVVSQSASDEPTSGVVATADPQETAFSDDEDSHPLPPSPLLPHEDFAKNSSKQRPSTLLAHENALLAPTPVLGLNIQTEAEQEKDRLMRRDSTIPQEADPNDLSLVRFPTDPQGIQEHLWDIQQRLPEDVGSEGSAETVKPVASEWVEPEEHHHLDNVQEEDEESEEGEVNDPPEDRSLGYTALKTQTTEPNAPQDKQNGGLDADTSKSEREEGVADGPDSKTEELVQKVSSPTESSSISSCSVIMGVVVALITVLVGVLTRTDGSLAIPIHH